MAQTAPTRAPWQVIDLSRKDMRMLTRRAAVWAAVSGVVGTCLLGISFAINPGPPAAATGAQVTAFGQQHHDAILWGAWLQVSARYSSWCSP